MLLHHPERVELRVGERVEVRGVIWNSITEVWEFQSEIGPWRRLFYGRDASAEVFATHPASEVRLVRDVARSAGPRSILDHWHSVLSRLSPDDPLSREWKGLTFVHPDSALARYLLGAPIESRGRPAHAVYPFRSNLSQQAAIANALSHPLSVVEGPPGTGKTQTILNLIANVLVAELGTIGVVSYNNAAVDNVREKLEEEGFGHVVADLGRREKRDAFFRAREERTANAETSASPPPRAPTAERFAEVAHRVRRLQAVERRRAECRARLDAYRLEFRHFEIHEGGGRAPDLTGLPLLKRSADRVLSYLAESELERRGPKPGWVTRVRQYFRYGSTRDLDPNDSDVVLRLQHTYYAKRIAEIELAALDAELRRESYDEVAEEYQELSFDALRAALDKRYRHPPSGTYTERTYRLGTNFARFVREHPVVLSTCHSLRRSLPDGYLLDYLVIDEASQADVLTAALAMACCRNLVVVGDSRQLQPVVKDRAGEVLPPGGAYDCREQSILSSVLAVYGEALARTLLVEHYRCAPAIIDFCNRAFYDGELIPYTVADDDHQAMVLWRTSEGNHMRQHQEGGRSNQREVDVVAREVVPEVADDDIGVIAPYRRQVGKLATALSDLVQPSTVHQVQGREQQVMILTTVLDETWRGQTGLRFVDDPCLINVAVSRATRTFVLVTNHDALPRSRHVRELCDHIRYQNPGDETRESVIVSIFDLLYHDYSERLASLASRLRGEMKYKSEDITWTVLRDLLDEAEFRHLEAVPQVLLRNLFADLDGLTDDELRYVRNRSSVDFVVYRRVSRRPVLAIEVDGFRFHENNVRQLERDALKNAIFARRDLPLVRLPTTGSDEQDRLRRELEARA